MQSLRDKLLKAGLVSEDAAKKAEAEKAAAPARRDDRPPRREDRPPGRRDDRPRDDRPPRRDDRPAPRRDERSAAPRRDDRPRPESRIPKLPPMAGTKEANRLMSKKQLGLDRTIREKVLASQVAIEPGATTFYFVTRKSTLRRLELSEAQAKMLEAGQLAVVERPDPDKIEHALVPPGIAEEIFALSNRAVRFLNKAGAQVGFLTEAEISQRASEATSGELADENPVDPHDEKEADKPAEGPFITIKRAPLP
jgi:hypothetical protein